MMKAFKTVLIKNTAEITEKRSRFIASIAHVETEQDAADFLSSIRTEHWSAKHNVYAYSLNKNSQKRFSDDGEPHGTAGKPVLDVITGSGLENVIIVVTRYFGGVLLGTGGLARAYSAAASAAVETAEICEMKPCIEAEIICAYPQFDILKKIIENYSCAVHSTDFSEGIIIKLCVDKEQFGSFSAEITDKFSNKICLKILSETFFPLKN